MKNKKILIYILFFVIYLCMMIFIIFSFKEELQNYSKKEVKIVDLNICSGETPETKLSDEEIPIISSTQKYFYICGYLETRKLVILSFYLHKEFDDEPIYSNIPGETFIQGFFSEQINLPITDQEGNYRIDIYYERNIIATKQFVIKNFQN